MVHYFGRYRALNFAFAVRGSGILNETLDDAIKSFLEPKKKTTKWPACQNVLVSVRRFRLVWRHARRTTTHRTSLYHAFGKDGRTSYATRHYV
jgi:DNA-binding phage protein